MRHGKRLAALVAAIALGTVLTMAPGGSAYAVGPALAPLADDEIPIEAREGWRYGTDYLFPLTRHIDETGLPLAGKIPLYPFTAALDLGQLAFGAVAGLFGD